MDTGLSSRQSDSWRERAVERSLRGARARAVNRSERFISAATELLSETGNLDFTVQELVERSGQSLRAFYQHFASKDELMLAVFEEVIRAYIDRLRVDVAAAGDPVEKLRVYVTSFYGAGQTSNPRASAALSRFSLMLTSAEPAELARVFEPQVGLLIEILDEGVRAGRMRTDVPVPALAMLMTQTLMSAVEMDILGAQLTGERVTTDALWAFCAGAALGPGVSIPSKAASRKAPAARRAGSPHPASLAKATPRRARRPTE